MIKNMTDQGLINHYWALRALAYNGAAMKYSGLGKTLKWLDITVAVARKRGINLLTSTPTE